MYFVEIDRSTIRPNPEYEKWLKTSDLRKMENDKLRNKLEGFIPKRASIFIVTDANILKVKELKEDLTLCGYICSEYGTSVNENGINVCVEIPYCNNIEEFMAKLKKLSSEYGFKIKRIGGDIDANWYNFDNEPPKYLYEYKPLEVICRHCGESFDHSEIIPEYDYDEFVISNACPFCHEGDCVDIEYEELSLEDYNKLDEKWGANNEHK
jgi:hypothetical protein